MVKDNSKVILVVEDEIPLQDVVRVMLKKYNINVITARTVEQAKELVNGPEKINAIWLDHYLLGKENGLDFMAWCKSEDSKCRDTPVFVVSNSANLDQVITYIHLGAKEYFVQSNYRLEEIIKKISAEINNPPTVANMPKTVQ